MVYTRRPSDQRCEEIYAYITEYVAENGHSPTFREVGNAVGLRSSSTVSRYIHRLVDEGRITIDESKPRTLSAASSGDLLETVRQRVCLEMADGGKIYMDCNLEKPRTAPVRLSFEGVLDAKRMKSRVGRVLGVVTQDMYPTAQELDVLNEVYSENHKR